MFNHKEIHNWKDAASLFVKHETCSFHKQAVMSLSNHADGGELLSVHYAMENKLNRESILLNLDCCVCVFVCLFVCPVRIK